MTARLVIVWLRISGGERKNHIGPKEQQGRSPQNAAECRFVIGQKEEGEKPSVLGQSHTIAANHSIDLQKSLAIVD